MAIAKDTREFQAMSVADADGLLMQLARLSAELKKKAAAAEKQKKERLRAFPSLRCSFYLLSSTARTWRPLYWPQALQARWGRW